MTLRRSARFAPLLLITWATIAAGTGTVRQEYSRVLNGRFIRVVNRSEYPAQAKNPKSEIHEDEGDLSVDRSRFTRLQ